MTDPYLVLGAEPGRGTMQRCAWCGVSSSRTAGERALLVPVPPSMLEYLLHLERRHGARMLYDGYGARAGERSRWWCRATPGCRSRRGRLATLPGA